MTTRRSNHHRTQRHPIETLLTHAAMGETPSAEWLDEIAETAGDDVPGATLRRQVKEAAERIVALRLSGHHGLARREALAAAARLLEPLGEYTPADPAASEMDPRKLADGVGEPGGGSRPLPPETSEPDEMDPRALAQGISRG